MWARLNADYSAYTARLVITHKSNIVDLDEDLALLELRQGDSLDRGTALAVGNERLDLLGRSVTGHLVVLCGR